MLSRDMRDRYIGESAWASKHAAARTRTVIAVGPRKRAICVVGLQNLQNLQNFVAQNLDRRVLQNKLSKEPVAVAPTQSGYFWRTQKCFCE